MIKALERQEASKETVETAEQLTPVTRSHTAPVATTSKEMLEDSAGLGLRGITRTFTGATLVDPGLNLSSGLRPLDKVEDKWLSLSLLLGAGERK